MLPRLIPEGAMQALIESGRRLLAAWFRSGTLPPPPEEPAASVREPRRRPPGGRSSSVSVAEPDPPASVRAVGKARGKR